MPRGLACTGVLMLSHLPGPADSAHQASSIGTEHPEPSLPPSSPGALPGVGQVLGEPHLGRATLGPFPTLSQLPSLGKAGHEMLPAPDHSRA